MADSNIEIILEECGWRFNAKKATWRLANFEVYKDKLLLAIKAGQEIALRKKIIGVIRNIKNCTKSDVDKIAATIERLHIKDREST